VKLGCDFASHTNPIAAELLLWIFNNTGTSCADNLEILDPYFVEKLANILVAYRLGDYQAFVQNFYGGSVMLTCYHRNRGDSFPRGLEQQISREQLAFLLAPSPWKSLRRMLLGERVLEMDVEPHGPVWRAFVENVERGIDARLGRPAVDIVGLILLSIAMARGGTTIALNFNDE
jgi:hypothetical protein